jgi:hypothetical protein
MFYPKTRLMFWTTTHIAGWMLPHLAGRATRKPISERGALRHWLGAVVIPGGNDLSARVDPLGLQAICPELGTADELVGVSWADGCTGWEQLDGDAQFICTPQCGHDRRAP